MTAAIPNTPGSLGSLWHAASADVERLARKLISEADQTGVLLSEFVHAFTTLNPKLVHVSIGPTRSTSTRVMEISAFGVRLLTEPGYALCPPVTDKFDDQVAQVVHKHGDVWVRCAAADTARRVDEARAVCAFSSVLADYNKALELQF